MVASSNMIFVQSFMIIRLLVPKLLRWYIYADVIPVASLYFFNYYKNKECGQIYGLKRIESYYREQTHIYTHGHTTIVSLLYNTEKT